MEGRANRTVLHFAVPPSILELLTEEPGDHAIDILIEVGTEHDGHTVDARLNFAAKERLAGVLPTAVFSDLRHCPAHDARVGVDTEVAQEDESVCSGIPGLALGLLAFTRFSPLRGE